MDLDPNKACCGTCREWQGKREVVEGSLIRLSSSAKGQCVRLDKIKPQQGGCDGWQKCGVGGDEKGETSGGS